MYNLHHSTSEVGYGIVHVSSITWHFSGGLRNDRLTINTTLFISWIKRKDVGTMYIKYASAFRKVQVHFTTFVFSDALKGMKYKYYLHYVTFPMG